MEVISTMPIEGQKPGTSGLRKKTRIFMESNYLENFVQSVFDSIGGAKGKTFVVGGDGRYFNEAATQTILKMAAANGAAKVIVGQNGLLSTPAASHLIRLNKTDGGFILSASHNPGGINEDFGIKFNMPNGGPAVESLTEAMFQRTLEITSYKICIADDVNISAVSNTKLDGMEVEVVDPVKDYAALMRTLFDFDAISALFASGFTMCFDAMHAITGPYASLIFEDQLGAPKGTVINGTPRPDFGGGHPDPNPVWAKELMTIMMADVAPDFGAASDGDGDRNMIVGHGMYITPSDSLAILAANAHLAPGYKKGISGIARSMPTSGAADLVAKRLGIEMFETPTGWKFFGNLLDAGKVTICGEESAGTGSDHVREKDGLWAVLLWLNILAVQKTSVQGLMVAHWKSYGRNYYSRHDFEAVESDKANALMQNLRDQLINLQGATAENRTIHSADDFSYNDPIDGSVSKNQGIRLVFNDGGRVVFRLSGTGTQGATLRVYLEQYVLPAGNLSNSASNALAGVLAAALKISRLEHFTSRKNADVIT